MVASTSIAPQSYAPEQHQDAEALPVQEPAPPAALDELETTVRQLDRRDWSLWITAVLILLLLCFTIFSLSFPGPWRREEMLSEEQLSTGTKGLFALVVLFAFFAIHQQRKMKQLRNKLLTQIAALSDTKARAEMIERLSIIDPSTGLFNRRFATDYLPREIARCERDKQSLIVAMIDLDDFAGTKERYGADAGDAVIAQFSYHIKKSIRSADLPVRMGTDQFMLILPECGVSDVYRPLERLRGCEVQHGSNTIPVHFTVAWVQRRTDEPADELMRRGGEALYKQKHPTKTPTR